MPRDYVAVLKEKQLWSRPVFVLCVLVLVLLAVCVGLGIVAGRISQQHQRNEGQRGDDETVEEVDGEIS